MEFVYQVYDVKTDPATGKADASAVVSILKDGKTPVAKAPPKAIESERDGASGRADPARQLRARASTSCS